MSCENTKRDDLVLRGVLIERQEGVNGLTLRLSAISRLEIFIKTSCNNRHEFIDLLVNTDMLEKNLAR